MTMTKRLCAALAVVLTGFLGWSPGTARAASLWYMYSDGASARFAQPSGAVCGGCLAEMSFISDPVEAFLTTTQQKGLIGNLTGKTITATFTVPVTGGSPTFIYNGEGQSWNPCQSPAKAILFLSSSSAIYSDSVASEPQNETHYWWSNPEAFDLAITSTSVAITDSLADPSQWSDANGHFGNDPLYAAGFAATVKAVKQIGLSFGGGCFSDVGVGVQGGYADLDLWSYVAQ